MELTDVRTQIDSIDSQLLELFCRRMDLAQEVAAAKKGMKKAVFDPARERAKLADIMDRAPARYSSQAVSLFSLLMTMNKAEQQKILHSDDAESLSSRARASLLPSSEAFPSTAHVACQGVEGAYSQIAACRLFRVPVISYFTSSPCIALGLRTSPAVWRCSLRRSGNFRGRHARPARRFCSCPLRL